MLARAHAFTVEGLHTRRITVEVDVRAGLPAFTIIGLADAAVREARDRVRTAILNSGLEFPARRVTANLAPADVRKAGPGLDLALAAALLAATGQLPREPLDSRALLGELALDGTVRPSRDTLAVARAARRAGLAALVLSAAAAHQAALVDGLAVEGVASLGAAVRVLRGGAADPAPPRPPAVPAAAGAAAAGDLADVRGQQHAVRALILAAAGGHNLLLSGAPGTGKTMLAQRAASILPPLSAEEAVEVTLIGNHAGCGGGLARDRPFRAPHHSTTAAGLIGRARRGWIGEAVLAHNGVLFLDELCEFARPALEALRQPLEEGRVVVARAGHSAVYPARFVLLAATNPCPCGYAGERERCACSAAELNRHRRRLSGPLLDRIDLLATLTRAARDDAGATAPRTSSADARELVLRARERQAARLAGTGVTLNAHMDDATARRHVRVDDDAAQLISSAGARGLLSARGQQRALRVARTIADLRGCERVRARDVGAALALRPDAAVPMADAA